MKNDITYEYRVFTNRRIDVDAMEIGRCTSKVIKELKPKDKVDGRFFHTSDTDEWFFCWNGELQTLNLKGDADLNAALDRVNELIKEANVAAEAAKETAQNAQKAAEEAKDAAEAASAAVSSIENKADKTYVDSVVAEKADKSDLNNYAKKSDIPSTDGLASESFVTSQGYLTKSEAESTYAKIGSGSSVDISGKQDKIEDLDAIRSGAAKGATALQSIPSEYVTETELNNKGYLTSHQDISGKQDKIEDLDAIRSGAAKGATALQEVPAEYVTQTEMNDALADLDNALSSKINEINKYISDTMFGEEA